MPSDETPPSRRASPPLPYHDSPPKRPIHPTVIFNPFARSERAGALWFDLCRLSRGCHLKLTKGPGNATKKAARAAQSGSPVVIAAGGDGTINEVINGLVGTDTALGILPTGTANVLARELGIPLDLKGAWEVIRAGHTTTVDLVRVDYESATGPAVRHLVQLGGIGLDAHIVRNVTHQAKNRWGALSYVIEALKSWNAPLPEISLELDGSEKVTGSFVLIGNGRFYGGPFTVFHKASMSDGLLDLCVFQSRAPLDLLVYLQAVLRGVHHKTTGIIYRHAHEVAVTSPSPVPVEVDGEFVGCLPGLLRVEPAALRILVPAQK